MSRGPGRIERLVSAVFADESDHAFTVEDLIDRVFAGLNRAEKKHRVSLIRAAKKVADRTGGWTWWKSETTGSTLIFWNRYSVLSYATARLKADSCNAYRVRGALRPKNDEAIRAKLQPGGGYHRYVAVGGAWWRHVQINIADRDDDQSEAARALRDEQAALDAAIRRMGASLRVSQGAT